jgi:AraC-like DNA-binding protein
MRIFFLIYLLHLFCLATKETMVNFYISLIKNNLWQFVLFLFFLFLAAYQCISPPRVVFSVFPKPQSLTNNSANNHTSSYQKVNIQPISDAFNQGLSQTYIKPFGDSALVDSIQVRWVLKEGFEWPFGGLKFILDEPLTHQYDSLHIQLRMQHPQDALRVLLKHKDTTLTKGEDTHNFWYFEKEFIPSKQHFFLASEFTIPAWWSSIHDIPTREMKEGFKGIQEIEFLNGYSPGKAKQGGFTLYSIELIRYDYRLFFLFIFILFALLIWFLYRLQQHYKSQKLLALQQQQQKELQSLQKSQLQLQLKLRESTLQNIAKTELPAANELNTILTFLTHNYNDAELSLEVAAEKCRLPNRRFSHILKTELGTSFKAYLNEIRLQEAARLLQENDAPVSEIAYKVGYNSLSHFSRIFKQKYELSPADFRKANSHSPNHTQ